MKTHTYSWNLLGQRVINTAEPENIKALLATQFKDFELPPTRKKAFYPTFGHGIFTTDGREWETSRSLLRPNFARSQVGDLETFESHISNLITKIPVDGSTIDLQPLFFMLTLDTSTEFLFGTSTNVLGSTNVNTNVNGEEFDKTFTYAIQRAGVQARIGKLFNLLPNKKYKESIRFVHEYVQSYIEKVIDRQGRGISIEKEARLQGERYVFLDELAKVTRDKKKIQDELLSILLAGRDTTASLLSYLFAVLARRPDVFEKLRAEVMNLNDVRPSFEQIKSLKYLQYCLNETLRLYPIVPSNARTAIRDTTLPLGGGQDGRSPILVKAGQQVNYFVHVMQRRKDLYGEDADEFKPERWETFRPSWQYLPFNGGPRICIGQQFALTEASYTTITILQAFKSIERRGGTDNIPDLVSITLSVRGGVNVGLTPA